MHVKQRRAAPCRAMTDFVFVLILGDYAPPYRTMADFVFVLILGNEAPPYRAFTDFIMIIWKLPVECLELVALSHHIAIEYEPFRPI